MPNTCDTCGKPTSRASTRCRACAQRVRRAESGVEMDAAMLRMKEQGRSLRQIAAVVGFSHERVRQRIARAIERQEGSGV